MGNSPNGNASTAHDSDDELDLLRSLDPQVSRQHSVLAAETPQASRILIAETPRSERVWVDETPYR